MNDNLLAHIEIQTGDSPKASIIWLHGLGADGNDFAPIVPELNLPSDLPIRFIFPHAPSIPVTINNGFVMPAWYDILDMNIDRIVDEVQLRASADCVDQFIENEISRGIEPSKIIIAGFSQGGAVALEAALRQPHQLGGLLAMSTYFATKNSVDFNAANANIPVMINHGVYDPIVPASLGKETDEILRAKGYSVVNKVYPMEHAVCGEQIRDIGQWIVERLS